MENYKKCKVENCEGNALHKNGIQIGKNFCWKHYQQIYKNGKILERTIFDPNKIIDCGDYYEICLYNRKCEEVGRAKIDKEDLEKVKSYKWHLDKWGYVRTNINGKVLKLHHLILSNLPIGYEIDHRFGDKLDNRKSELRFATSQQNSMNRKAKGYYLDKKNKKWYA